jgi:hypothetical protein
MKHADLGIEYKIVYYDNVDLSRVVNKTSFQKEDLIEMKKKLDGFITFNICLSAMSGLYNKTHKYTIILLRAPEVFLLGGILVLDEKEMEVINLNILREGRGLGRVVFKDLCKNVTTLWSVASAIGFWEKMGFKTTGFKKEDRNEKLQSKNSESQSFLFEMKLTS